MLGQTLSHYRITARIGAGGMGEVYRARDEHLHRDVAVKVLPSGLLEDEAARRRFRKEALTLSRLNHPNIATVYDFDRQDGVDFLVMEFVEGQDLAALIRSAGGGRESAPGTDATARTAEAPPPEGLDEATCIRLADQIAAALEEAHEHGIVHRDLKPHNVMVTPKGQVKVLDFGLAKLVRDPGPEAATETLTQMGMVAGTLPYMAPEQVQGHPADARTDVYAWGVTLYELLTGRRPYPQTDATTLVAAIVQGEPPSLSRVRPGMSPWLEAVVLRALAREPERRYASAAELRAELAARTATIPGAGRRRRGLVVGALAVLAVALGTWLYTGREGAGGDARTSLAVLYFENLADPSDSLSQGPSLTNLLITDLSESRYLDVLSGQRLRDLVKLQGKEGEHVLDGETSTAVAQQAGMGTMLVGSILQSVPQLLITSQLVDVESGATRASQRVLADPGEDLFAVVDRLAAEVKRDLELPEEAAQELDRPVSAVTTESEEAYRYYLEGLEYLERFSPHAAMRSFERAIAADSTFAMAYYYHAMTPWQPNPEQRKRYVALAQRHASRATARQREMIEVLQDFLHEEETRARASATAMAERMSNDKEVLKLLGFVYAHSGAENASRVVSAMQRILDLDPMDRWALSELAYHQDVGGDWLDAVVTAKRFVELFPEEANAFDVLGDIYAYGGETNQAILAYERAQELGYLAAADSRAYLLLLQGRAEEADALIRVITDDASRRPCAWIFRGAMVPVCQGRMREALDTLDSALESFEMDGCQDEGVMVFLTRIQIYVLLEDWQSADLEWQRFRPWFLENVERDWPFSGAEFEYLIDKGELDAARAKLGSILRSRGASTPWRLSYEAMLHVASGEPVIAVAKADSCDGLPAHHWLQHVRARVYLEADRPFKALEILESMLRRHKPASGRIPGADMEIVGNYRMGLAYERVGWTEKAIEAYEKFLYIWRDADPGIPILEDANRRLAALEN